MSGTIYPVTVPKWGIEMQEGTISGWHSEVGSTVNKGDELVDIETDKIVNTMEAPASGELARVLVEEGDTLKVGALLALIAPAGTNSSDLDDFVAEFKPVDAGFGIDEDAGEETPATSDSPKAGDRPAAQQSTGEAPRVSPVAKRRARELGVDLSTVRGSGRNGRISKEDVERAAAGGTENGPSAATEKKPTTTGEVSMALDSRALAQARRMVEAKQTIPHFYLCRQLDVSPLVPFQQNEKVSWTALLLKGLASAMDAHPKVNAHLKNDTLYPQEGIHINVAVETEDGLLAPLLRNVHRLSLQELNSELKDLAERARGRALKREDLEPGGMTLSNLGMLGINQFSAIINPPQLAILAVGTLEVGKTWPDRGMTRSTEFHAMSATLSCDHRALDGAAGARFLGSLQDALLELER